MERKVKPGLGLNLVKVTNYQFDEIIGHNTCERKYFTLENNDIIYKRLKEETDLDYLPYLGACVDFGLGDLVLEEDIDKFKVYFVERMSKYDYMEYGNLKDAVDDLINKCTRYKDNKDEIQEKMRNIFYETLNIEKEKVKKIEYK